MSTARVFERSEVEAMLDACAPGNERELKEHRVWVRWRGKAFKSVRKGGHSESDPEIKVGTIRKMVQVLEIPYQCANAHLEGLKARNPAEVLDAIDEGDDAVPEFAFADRHGIAAKVLVELQAMDGGFAPTIAVDGGQVRVLTGHAADFLEVGRDGAVRCCSPTMTGREHFPPKWIS